MNLENIGIDSVKLNKHEKMKHCYTKDIDHLDTVQYLYFSGKTENKNVICRYSNKSFVDRDYRSREPARK